MRNARIEDGPGKPTVDVGIDKGRIAAIGPDLTAEGEEINVGGRLVTPGFIETHIHLDRSCILDRCRLERGDLEEAIKEVAKIKKAFTPEDVYDRSKKALEKCILNGTTHIRTQLEVDPGIGLRGLEGILPHVDEYKWAIDIELCIFPQEGLINNPGTDELMVTALKNGVQSSAPPRIPTATRTVRSTASSNWPGSSASISTCTSISVPTPTNWTSTTSARSRTGSTMAAEWPSGT